MIWEKINRWIEWAWYYISARRVKRVAEVDEVIITRSGKLYFVDMVTINGAVRIRNKKGRYEYILPKHYRVMEDR